MDVTSFIEADIIGADICGTLVASRVLEEHLGKALCNFQGGIHVAERGRKDEIVALVREFRDNPLGVGAFGNVLDIARLDLVPEMRHEFLASDLVLVGPAEITHRPEINEPDLRHGGFSEARLSRCRPNDQRRA